MRGGMPDKRIMNPSDQSLSLLCYCEMCSFVSPMVQNPKISNRVKPSSLFPSVRSKTIPWKSFVMTVGSARLQKSNWIELNWGEEKNIWLKLSQVCIKVYKRSIYYGFIFGPFGNDNKSKSSLSADQTVSIYYLQVKMKRATGLLATFNQRETSRRPKHDSATTKLWVCGWWHADCQQINNM